MYNRNMKYGVLAFVFAAVLLTGCQQTTSVTENSSASNSSVISAESSSVQYVHWKTYQDAKIGIRIDYPSDEYSVTPKPSDDYIQFGDKKIAIEGVRIGDAMPEGNGVQLYRTKDSQILDYLQQYKPFTAKKTVNGTDYQQFEFIGMGDVYGYVTQKNGLYYVLDSLWGPNNPVSEKMLQSLVFEK